MGIGWLVVASSLLCGAANAAAIEAAIEAANEGDKARAIDLEAAIAKYQRAVELDPQSHRIRWKLALAYAKKESWQDVDRTLEQAIALAPKHAGYVMTRGVALARLAKWPEAKKTLEQAIAVDPNLGDAHHELAEVALRLGDEKTALVEYTKAVELLPNVAAMYGPLADLYLRLGFAEHAERVLVAGEANVKDEATKFVLYVLHGQILEGRGDLPGAVARFESAKKACGACNERGQHIIFFELGATYASLKPPRKSEAMLNLQSFSKMVCKGAAASRYADQCTQAQQIAMKLGGAVR